MEQNLAILIADLSGYTALTETHGPSVAADTVDRFVEIANASLAGSSTIHQRVGDELMIVADTADHLLATAVQLLENCSGENYFLQLHGGMHYGKVLKRNQHYFGSPVNLASRIATSAKRGTFRCSSSFVDSLSNPSLFSFSEKGMHNFKNVSEETEVFELLPRDIKHVHVDPVCKMHLHEDAPLISHPTQAGIHFCSDECLKKYTRKN